MKQAFDTYSRVPGREEDREGRWQIDVLVSNSDQDTTPGASEFLIQDWIQDRVIALNILHQQGVAESKRTLQVLSERIIKEATRNNKEATRNNKKNHHHHCYHNQSPLITNHYYDRRVSPGSGDFLAPEFIHDKLSGLTRRVDDQWISVVSFQHDGILDAEVVAGQGIRLPLQPFIRSRKIL